MISLLFYLHFVLVTCKFIHEITKLKLTLEFDLKDLMNAKKSLTWRSGEIWCNKKP